MVQIPRPFFLKSAAFAELSICLALLGSIYLPSANSICFRYAQTRYDINPRSRSEHIECLRSKHHIERVSVYRKSVSADLYRRVVSLRALRIHLSFFGAGNGISARGGLSRQTVHRTVWSFGQIAVQFSPYFKSHFIMQKDLNPRPIATLVQSTKLRIV